MKKLIRYLFVLTAAIACSGTSKATTLSALLLPGGSLQVGDKVFTNFAWSSSSFLPSAINITTLGDGTPNNLYGIDIQGGFSQLGVGAKVGRLNYAVYTIGNFLI